MTRDQGNPDRMTFLEHLDELRARLIRSLVAIVVALGVCWAWSPEILGLIMEPLQAAFPGVRFITTAPTEAFALHVKAAFAGGVFLAAPFVFYQAWAFISPGLYSHEKKYAVPFVGLGSVFFILGGAFGHLVLFPATFRFLGQFTNAQIEYLPRLSEYFSFYFWFVVGLGLVFQLPVAIFVLSRVGLVSAGFLLRNFKFAVLAAFLVSAVITPSGDVVNQSMLAGPIIGLYLLGVGVAWLFGRKRGRSGAGSVAVILALTTYNISRAWARRA